MVNDKLLAVDAETHAFVNSLKLIPTDPAGNALKRLLVEKGFMKSGGDTPVVPVIPYSPSVGPGDSGGPRVTCDLRSGESIAPEDRISNPAVAEPSEE